MSSTVRAAGTVLWRRAAHGAGVEVALIHRPRYDDWSLPKGKLKRGEDHAAAAVRETREETGVECVLGTPLPAAYYWTAGRPKEVRYWAAEAPSAASTPPFSPNDEVDRIVWLPPEAARRRLTHDRDSELVAALLRVLAG
ncbi:putative mutT-like protein [Actinacidiphila reveromycinica]|uniref:Putative mutT-like protein n=1 Tax=Actinacidiphila reveromycinica TaxID=659352 RepID=A0A7U3UUT7_9ACTN|nr:NUDIX hydrolase [Streptomyces sp. SN-593]BBA99164.1 putative mutT-like protein [Streptomyces sp. SN-593]